MRTYWWIFVWGTCCMSCQNGSNDASAVLVSFPEEVSASFGPAQDRGLVENTDLDEISGLAVSLSNPNYLWCHNDSGDEARVYLMGQDGRDAGFIFLESVKALDWEDMAIFRDPQDQVNYLYLADIGDNQGSRLAITVYRVPEPNLAQASFPYTDTLNAAQVQAYTYLYENGPRDAEAFMIDKNGDWYVMSKSDPSFYVYQIVYPQIPAADTGIVRPLGSLAETLVTAADLNQQTGDILIKTYTRVYAWNRSTDMSGGAGTWMFEQGSERLNYTLEPQGEAIAWLPDGSAYFTVSEELLGQEARLFFYERL